ncbi:MAG: thiamine phosphate synthase [Luteimonas sp.]|nr:thiamine phosphate synthase [Luteimonas sp.]
MNSPRPRSGPKLRGLYLITPDDAETGRLLGRVTAVLPYAALLQYRNKSANDALRRSQLLALLPACRAAGVPLIVNDDWKLAIELEADGAHLGSDDGDLRHARDNVRDDFVLGASCYDDPRRAEAAAAAGADYLAFGAFHPSPTKPDARRADPQLLRDGRRHGLPLVAIGGITADNAPALVAAGAAMIAVISGVFDAFDPVAAARAYARHFDLPDSHFPEDT